MRTRIRICYTKGMRLNSSLLRRVFNSPQQCVCLAGLLTLLPMAGCKAATPSAAETRVAYFVKRNITVGGRHDHNPLPSTADSIKDGKELFASECAVCHGLDGQNTGVPFADKMAPHVPRLNTAAVQAYTDGQLKWIIKYGLYPSGMPAAGPDFGDDDEWAMVNYIRHLPPAGSLGDPAAYGGAAH